MPNNKIPQIRRCGTFRNARKVSKNPEMAFYDE